ncbi:DMT family transporter [Paenibacillus sp.]|jgi:drug/metabolite transporter (DMT)-like permease|uniref:DMT family transporter n=1 Tax=Paenibacillus sp. TaxID=58172 RepID=UPI002824246E|nr:DMT family transporter [Paenibacillus sp.]MDR0270796.1 DMT family transporter [Paenibacillus sp.]
MKVSTHQKATLAVVINAIIIGFSFIFVKQSLSFADPLNSLAHRFTFSFIVATLFVFPGWSRLKAMRKQALAVIPLALLNPSLFFALQAFGLQHASSAIAGIVQAMVPVFTMILAAVFLKERISAVQRLCTLLSVSGVILVFAVPGIGASSASLLGITLILLSALASAGYTTLARKLTQTLRPKDLTYMMILFGFIVFNLIALVKNGAAGTMGTYFVPLHEPGFIIDMAYLGVLSFLVTSFLSNYALSILEASKVSVFAGLSTVVTIAGGVLLLHEQLGWYHWVGAIMIVAGVMGVNLSKKKLPLVQETAEVR